MKPHRAIVHGLIVVTLILVTFLAFWRVTKAQYVYFDDDHYTWGNPIVLGGLNAKSAAWAFTTFEAANYHPLTWLSLLLDTNIYGTKPLGYHLTNLFLHVLAVVLLYAALEAMTGAPWRCGLVALIFAVHPLRVESVAWISERKDVLSGCLAMATMLVYALYARRPNWWRYLIIVALFILGLLAKPMLVPLPFLLLLLDVWPLRRLAGLPLPAASSQSPTCPPRSPGMLILEKIPLLALSIASCVITYIAQAQGGAVRTLNEVPFRIRLTNVPVAYIRYLIKMAWFRGLTILYPTFYWPWWMAAGATVLLLLITAGVLFRFRANPWLAIGWFWYLGMLVPVIGLVKTGEQSMADRYTYLPAIGLLVMLAWSLPAWFFRTNPGRWVLGVATLAAVAVLLPFTWRQIGYWRSSETLLTHVIQYVPQDPVPYINLGLYLYHVDHRPREALGYLFQAVKIDPHYPLAQFDLGMELEEQSRGFDGFFREGLVHLRLASQLQPNHAEPHNVMGIAFMNHKMPAEAMVEFKRALEVDPSFFRSYVFMGKVLVSSGQIEQAMKCFQRAMALDPNDAWLLDNVGSTLLSAGRYNEAAPYLEKLIKINPSARARAMLGQAHVGLQDVNQSLQPAPTQP